MTDKELLEAAANATGHKWKWTSCPKYGIEVPGMHVYDGANEVDYYIGWNPLEENKHALTLAAKLRISINWRTNQHGEFVVAESPGMLFCTESIEDANEESAMRRAIVRSAAQLSVDSES